MLGMSLALKGYLKETRRPVYSAALVFPFLGVYHVGTILLKTTHINGADALIIRLLSALSVHSMLGSALVLTIFFTVWQLRARASWKLKSPMLLLSFLESACFAFILLFLFGWMTRLSLAGPAAGGSRLANLVLYCGAGVYEELLFRALLLGLLIAVFARIFRWKKGTSAAAAVTLGALLFSAFHYLGPAGDALSVASFVQRALGGLYFSIIFVTRGFGVAAAAHATYDILVGLILA